VASVERGTRYRAGEEVRLGIDCVTASHPPMPGPFPGYRQDQLSAVRKGRAYVTGDRVVRRGFDVIPEDKPT